MKNITPMKLGNDIHWVDKMNHLQVLQGEGGVTADGDLINFECSWEHANDFNFGNQNSQTGYY